MNVFGTIYTTQMCSMVSGLPEMKMPMESCEECMHSKKQKNYFNKGAGKKNKEYS
ncbi:hypothetical protein MTR_4g017250 [Medicago truncatula]|uniref:Uncharacterized protein n=1 Tax=Medicago truncatula TaxID=3880 RepID=G7JQ63_MEDTR|nr:hypothetical protein MTR_4g017250 [Medicago truncatula]